MVGGKAGRTDSRQLSANSEVRTSSSFSPLDAPAVWLSEGGGGNARRRRYCRIERFSAFVEFTPASTDVSFVVLQIDDNTQGNRYSIAVHNTDSHLGWHVYAIGVAIETLDPQPPFVVIDGVVNKVCVIVDKPGERVGVSLNGSDVVWSKTAVTTWPQDLTTLRIGSSLGAWFFREP